MSDIIEIDSSKRMAVIIAIEDYRKGPSAITSVRYAKNDAERFKKTLIEDFKYEESDIIMWINGEAVKSAMENDLPYYVRQLTNEHQFIFYYVGHGFYQDDHNRLTCWDSHPFNLSETTVSIKEVLLDPLKKSECKQSLIFLDCCSSFLKGLPGSRDVLSNFNHTEFEEFIGLTNYNAVFMSCSPGEKSYSSDSLKHGIWTWHLTEALAGKQDGAVIKDVFITDNSLRNFLSASVPAYITKEMSIKGNQRPYAKIDASNDFLILKLPKALSEIDNSLPNFKLNYENAVFRKIVFKKINQAEGFTKGYSIPKFRNRTSDQFVKKVFEPEIQGEVQEVYENAKKVLNLKKVDFVYGSSRDGGSVECKFFRYFVDIEHSSANISEAKITRRLMIRVNRSQLPTNFDSIFPLYVDELIIPIEGDIDFDDLVNKFENLKQEQGGDFSDNEMEGVMEYITDGGTSLKVDTSNKELIITHYSPMRSLDLIDKSIDDIKRISGYKVKLLL